MKLYTGSVDDRKGPQVGVYEFRQAGGQMVFDYSFIGWLNPRYDLRRHSPNGFAWGYHGSGPAQLALALLADVVGGVQALELYQTFKSRVIANLDQNAGWSMHDGFVAFFALECDRLLRSHGDEKLRQAIGQQV